MARIAKAAKGYETYDTKSEPFVQVNVYMAPRQRRRLRLAAAAAGVSMSEYIKSRIFNNLPEEDSE